MSSGAIIIALNCMECGRAVSPLEAIRIGESVVRCPACYYHQRAIMESWGNPPQECALCHTSFPDLAARSPNEPVSMFPHLIDGTLGMLCVPCDRAYVLKRADQFRGTRFGWDRKV